MTELHAELVGKLCGAVEQDARFVGVALGGSYAAGRLDRWSDLDVILVVDDNSWDEVHKDRSSIAAQFGPLLVSFSGEHTGEPRLLICLFGPPLLHVDVLFTTLDGLNRSRVDNPVVKFDRNGLVAAEIRKVNGSYPPFDSQWAEERFWTWMHYAATKLGRGELFAAADFLSAIRARILGPLIRAATHLPQGEGVRRLEFESPQYTNLFSQTYASGIDKTAIARAMLNAVRLYKDLRVKVGASLEKFPDDHLIESFISDAAAPREPAGDNTWRTEAVEGTWQFDEAVADDFSEIARTNIPDYGLVIDQCVRVLIACGKRDGRIIDVGCATGETLRQLKSAGFSNVV